MPTSQIHNPLGAFGLNAGITSQTRISYRNTSGGTITIGDLVVLDTSVASTTTYPNNVPGSNVTTTTSADVTTVIGFAAETAADGAEIEVATAGLAPSVNVATGTTAGALVTSSTTAGRAAIKQTTAVVGEIIGVVVGATAASNLASVYIFKA